jgi:hypothetical protein
MSTKSRQVIWGGRIIGADIRARSAREAAQRAAQKPIGPRLKPGHPHGGLGRARPAIPYDRPMPQWRTGLARGGMQSLQIPGEPAARRHPPAAGHSDMETGSLAEMPVLPEGPLRAAGTDDQADRGARDSGLQVGAPGRGPLSIAGRGVVPVCERWCTPLGYP